MSVAGLCSVCSAGDVAGGCDRCGGMVCREHYDRRTGLCTDCLTEVNGDPTGRRRRPDGTDEYRFRF